MPRRFPPINARQQAVLRWVADGCPDGVMTDFTYKNTCRALQERGLVTVSRRGGVWRATLTPGGVHYLECGTYLSAVEGQGGHHDDPPTAAVPRGGARDPSRDATVDAMQRTRRQRRRTVTVRQVEVREVIMRYRVLITRVQVAERFVRAIDEEDAVRKVREEFDRPYGYFGSWKTTSSEVDVVEVEQTTIIKPSPLSPDGALLVSLKDAGRALGISYGTVYELVTRIKLGTLAALDTHRPAPRHDRSRIRPMPARSALASADALILVTACRSAIVSPVPLADGERSPPPCQARR